MVPMSLVKFTPSHREIIDWRLTESILAIEQELQFRTVRCGVCANSKSVTLSCFCFLTKARDPRSSEEFMVGSTVGDRCDSRLSRNQKPPKRRVQSGQPPSVSGETVRRPKQIWVLRSYVNRTSGSGTRAATRPLGAGSTTSVL